MKKRSDYKKDEKSVENTKFIIIVPREEDKQELMDAFQYFHDEGFDPDLVTVNQLAHEYLYGSNIIVSNFDYEEIEINRRYNEVKEKERDPFFRKQKYEKEHKLCPKCGSDKYDIYIIDEDNLEKLKDKNICECLACGNKHIVHDRISIEKFKSLQKK